MRAVLETSSLPLQIFNGTKTTKLWARSGTADVCSTLRTIALSAHKSQQIVNLTEEAKTNDTPTRGQEWFGFKWFVDVCTDQVSKALLCTILHRQQRWQRIHPLLWSQSVLSCGFRVPWRVLVNSQYPTMPFLCLCFFLWAGHSISSGFRLWWWAIMGKRPRSWI